MLHGSRVLDEHSTVFTGPDIDAHARTINTAKVSYGCFVSGSSPKPRLFIGSSSEGREVARNLQVELGECDVVRWDQNVFEASGYTLDSLLATASSVDFAVIVATPDDTTVSRGETQPSARDNIVLEFGLFAGALGRDRTYLLATGDLKLPTDVLGLTRLPYRPQADGSLRAAVSEAALQVDERVRSLGPLQRRKVSGVPSGDDSALISEIDLLCANAVAQGWTVKTNSATTLRVRSPLGSVFTLSRGRPPATRIQLRQFVAELRAAGLRVNNSIRRPVEESPH